MSNSLLVRTIRGEQVERPPVWAMRQAGRWDSEFRKIRGDLSFFEFSENVELAAQASLLPRRFGVDGIILFYDITTLPLAMGLPFELQSGRGPVPDRVVQSKEDLKRLDPDVSPSSYSHIRELLAKVKENLNGELPVLVFAGAPFTVATYCIGTGKDMDATRAFASSHPDVWNELLERLTNATFRFLDVLSDDGADVYQLFDSWAGMLTREEYEQWAQPYHARILQTCAKIPRILFVKECPFLDLAAQTGADAISLGTSHLLAEAKQKYPHLVFQGNVDQSVLRDGTPEEVKAETWRCLTEGGGHRHIVNLSHGVDRNTPMANFEAYINAVKSYS